MGKKKKKKDEFEEEVLKEETQAEEATEAEAEEPQAEEGAEPSAGGEPQQDTAEDKIADLEDKLKRNMAEFDNFRKRTETEKAARFELGQRSVVEKILPIIDNFERGLATIEGDKDAFAEGMDKTYKQMMSLLEELGVKPIDAVGQPFDPNFHNAVMHVEDDSQPENTVVEELQKGYKMGDAVIRYSMVKVAN